MIRAVNGAAAKGSGLVLGVLAASQFLMTLDSSVMNVSMASVAADLGTTITGIQTAITLYTLVMATLMITGGKVGTIIGRRRAFAIGLVVYGCRVAGHRARPEPGRAAGRVVAARRHRRRPDHARDRRAGGRQLPAGERAGVRAGRRVRCDGGRRRPAHRWRG